MVKFFVKVLSRLGLLSYINISISHRLQNGGEVRVPIIQKLGLENLELAEPWMSKVIQLLLPLKNGFFFDVGVNIGQTLIKVRSLNKDAPYIGFEPNPICVFYSRELVRLNKFKNTDIIPVGIAEDNQLLPLFFYSDGDLDSSASIVENFRPEKIFRKEFVPCFSYRSIQSIVKDKVIAILKIDVEGAELSVLKSMDGAIRAYRPFILVEILPVYSLDNKVRIDRQREIESMVSSMDYLIFRIVKTSNQFQDFAKIHEFGLTTKVEESDYFLCPRENGDTVLRKVKE